MQSKIISARLLGDHTGFCRMFDATREVLLLDLAEIHNLTDFDCSTDYLAPESLIEEARRAFRDVFGRSGSHAAFGYGVEIVSAVRTFFGVCELHDVTEGMLASARAALPHGPAAGGITAGSVAGAIESLISEAEAHSAMGRDFPTGGPGSLLDRLETILGMARRSPAPPSPVAAGPARVLGAAA